MNTEILQEALTFPSGALLIMGLDLAVTIIMMVTIVIYMVIDRTMG